MDNISDIISNFISRQLSNDEIEEDLNSMASPTQSSTMSTNLTPSGSNTSVSTLGSHNGTNAASKFPPGSENQPIFTKPRLSELVREVDGSVQLDEDVEELLLQIADDFVDDAINSSCLFAKHRKSNKIEVRDVQLHLERKWNMWIPGFGTDELRPYKRSVITEAHKQRLALIRKTIKKY